MRLIAPLILLAGFTAFASAQQQQQPTTAPAALLQQLDGEVRQAYCRTIEGVVRVYLPAKAMNPASDLLRKWERRLNPDVRQRLGDPQAAATTVPSPTTGPVAGTQPAAAPNGEYVTIGIVLDDAGELLVPAYLERGKLPDPLRVVTKDGQTTTATIVGSDRSTAVTLLRCDRAVGKPLKLAPGRPVEGALLIALLGDETRLLVWTGGNRESAVAVLPDGSVGVLRGGRFLGGPGYATLLEQLRRHGRARRGVLGMLVRELQPAQQTRLAKLNVTDRPGLEIPAVLPNSPAEKAGIKAGDVLLTVNGHAVPDMTSLAAILTDVTGPTTLTVGRDDARVDVTVEALPAPTTK